MDQNPNYPDAELLAAMRTQNGLDKAIRSMYRNYYAMTRSYILKNSGQPEDAEDIFQEVVITFIDIVQKNKFRGESSIRTFLYSLARHAWLNELKKRGSTRIRDEKFGKSRETVDIDAANIISNRESMNLLMKTIEKLGETCKKILLAFYFENRPVKEILEALNYENEQVVRNKKYKCLKQLEQWVNDEPQLAQNLKSILYYE